MQLDAETSVLLPLTPYILKHEPHYRCRVLLLDALLGNPDRLPCARLKWAGNPGEHLPCRLFLTPLVQAPLAAASRIICLQPPRLRGLTALQERPHISEFFYSIKQASGMTVHDDVFA